MDGLGRVITPPTVYIKGCWLRGKRDLAQRVREELLMVHIVICLRAVSVKERCDGKFIRKSEF